jgi:N-succinyldiaminopimelate aminotransferase
LKLRALLAGVAPPAPAIRLSIGEPQHATPDFVRTALVDHLDGLPYPATAGSTRSAERYGWFMRYALPRLDAATEVLPVNGICEAPSRTGVIDCSRRRSWSARTRSTRL